MTADLLTNVEFRLVGPFRGGRVVAVAGHPYEAGTFYFGSTGGGVWRTTDGGVYWENLSDGFFQRASVGAIAISVSDPNVLYVGMGESTIRGNVAHGDGVYRSTDAGKTWTHLGLTDTRHISKVRIHPSDPDTVYVAALGHAHGPNQERGIFRSRDGGKTWEHVLFRNQEAGANDLIMDPFNPRVLYAAFWQTRRTPWSLTSGGPGSGLFKSDDGGDTWTEISRNKGLPKGLLGKIGVTASAAQRDRLFAIVEAENGAVFRSEDGGERWEKASDDRNLRQRAWYYHHIVADPRDSETVWVLNVETYRSNDGGRTFQEFPTPHGDNHDLWIDSRDTRRMIQGNDGGATITYNGGQTWSSLYNQPTAEFYHVTADSRTPYRLYGAQQDNTTMSVPSRSALAAITNAENWEVGGGESGYIAVRPDNPDIIFAGSYLGFLTRFDHSTGQSRSIEVWPEEMIGSGAKDARYRFQWTFPTLLSAHDPNVLYVTGNHVFRSTDEGASWQQISPDLTRNDVTKFESSGGPLTKDNTGAEYYGTIFAFAESLLEQGVLWAGSDDGLIHVSRNNGKSWQNVTPPGLPDWSLVSIIEASPHEPGAAYVAATRYKLDDFAPYLFKTADYGATWLPIVDGLASNVFVRVIREDPILRGLLYVGTETGIQVSYDDGASWQPMKGNLPVVPVHDLAIKEPEGDLLVATHGRSFWVLDDLSPVRALAAARTDESPTALLVKPRPVVKYGVNSGFGHRPVKGRNYRFMGPFMVAYQQVEVAATGEKVDRYYDAAANPPNGAVVSYFLRTKPAGDITLTFLESDGTEIRTFSSKDVEHEADAATPSATPGEIEVVEDVLQTREQTPKKQNDPRIAKEEGLNRFVWNLRYPDATKLDDDELANELVEGGAAGPVVPPGSYRLRLTVGEQTFEQEFTVVNDPRVGASDAELKAQYELLLRLRDRLSEVHKAVNEIRVMSRRAADWVTRAKDKPELEAVARAARAVVDRLKPIEAALIQVEAKTRGDTLNFPVRLNGKLAALAANIASADAKPTTNARAVFDDLSVRVQAQLDQLSETVVTEVGNLNEAIRKADLPPVGV
ncbi:MAG TPA: glycosyl hydrolase [Chloroflexota bacterium]|nr:glycosyl hydrolase [Chloroflexota bacterium]